MMRSSWEDDATVIGFRSTDYYQGHFHQDAGSFVVYRNGLLAVDAGRYTKYTESLRAPIVATGAHNSLLLGGEGQRLVKGQWYKDLDAFNRARGENRDDRRLEMGDLPFFTHGGEWTAVAGQFAQAYSPGVISSCVRQLLYVRPNTLVVVDTLVPSQGKNLPEVRWMIHLPGNKLISGKGFVETANERSWLRCRSMVSEEKPVVEESMKTQLGSDPQKLTEISRADFVYGSQPGILTLVHLIDVGDGQPGAPANIRPRITADRIEIALDGKIYSFSKKYPFTVEAR
jgi:hypothetical protein